jgi:alkylation response protein AidB-like acyl-CoA dehydrogenase
MNQFSEVERDELRDTIRRFLNSNAPLHSTRRVVEAEPGYDVAAWTTMTAQLGLAGLPIAEEFGGAGASTAELAVVMHELGRANLPSPYLASVVLAAEAISRSGDEAAKKEWLPRIAAGELLATLAVTDDDGRCGTDSGTLRADRSEDGYLLSGHRLFVIDGQIAELILVAARTEGGVSLFAVDGDAPGVRRTALPTLDSTRRQSRVEFTETPARLVGTEGQAHSVFDHTLDLAAIALAAEQLGGAERCLEMALEYAKERVAFGRPIGGFQAIKHKFADLLLEVQFARSAVEHAVAAAAAGDPGELSLAASVAKAHCSDMYAMVATECIHIHGAIGFTWEHDAQLFFKRAKSSQLMFGDVSFHRERIAAELLDGAR